jgi:hypothetical protein
MSKKVSITMSDELFERLSKVRDNFNISKICQESLEKEITIEELSKKTGDDTAIIERLKLQKDQSKLNSRQQGQQDGIVLAKFMSYVQLKAFVSFKVLFYYEKEDDFEGGETVKSLINYITLDLSEEEEKFNYGNGNEPLTLFEIFENNLVSFKINIRQYFIGFVNGVVSFYEGIKEKIEDIEIIHEGIGHDLIA